MMTRFSRADVAWSAYLLLLVAHGVSVTVGWRRSDSPTYWGQVRETWDVFGVLAVVTVVGAAMLTWIDSAGQGRRDRVVESVKAVVVGGLLLLVMYGAGRVVVSVETVLATLGLGWLVWRRFHPTTKSAHDR